MSDRALKILLTLSLAFNVFIIGAVAGASYMWYANERAKLTAAQRGLRFAAENLSPEQRTAFLEKLAEARRAAKPEIDAARESRETLARLLLQTPFDAATINAELTKIRNADITLRTRLEEAVVNFAAALSPADRQKLVEGLQERSSLFRRTVSGKN